ncbi:hypothetical protein ACDY96_32580 [Rhizobium mongolense]|uniref:hypothetical protein n=1 Tax=Rhizobium TaxID=379 RepID=UPI001F3FD5B1|nr:MULTISPECIES: hypothetical protein [Rhizobium]
MRPRSKPVPLTGAPLPGASSETSDLLSCSKADAFDTLKKEGNRLFLKRLPDWVMP